MNLKRIFGALLTILGIIGIIYAAVTFANTSSLSVRVVKEPIIYGVIGLLFFISGINLIRTTKDEA